MSLTTYLDVGNGEFLQGGNRLFCPELLMKTQRGIEYDDGQNDTGVHVIAQCGQDHRSHNEDHHHRCDDLFPRDRPRAARAAFDQFIGAIGDQPSRGLRRRQPFLGVRAELRRNER